MRDISAKHETIAYRAWFYCEPLGWNIAAHEVAEALNVPPMTFNMVMGKRGWSQRFRAAMRNQNLDFVGQGKSPDDGDLPKGVSCDD